MKHIASCSFGKDSIATILLALEHGEPLDGAVFSEVMFDAREGISGEIPEHIEWIYGEAIPKLERMGCPVKVVRRSDYVTEFWHVNVKGKRIGTVRGFPMGGRCVINQECKIKPIREWYRELGDRVTQYVGIAADEPIRLARLKEGKVSLLAKYGKTEADAMEMCRAEGLLSPIYATSHRGGVLVLSESEGKSILQLSQGPPGAVGATATAGGVCEVGSRHEQVLFIR